MIKIVKSLWFQIVKLAILHSSLLLRMASSSYGKSIVYDKDAIRKRREEWSNANLTIWNHRLFTIYIMKNTFPQRWYRMDIYSSKHFNKSIDYNEIFNDSPNHYNSQRMQLSNQTKPKQLFTLFLSHLWVALPCFGTQSSIQYGDRQVPYGVEVASILSTYGRTH